MMLIWFIDDNIKVDSKYELPKKLASSGYKLLVRLHNCDIHLAQLLYMYTYQRSQKEYFFFKKKVSTFEYLCGKSERYVKKNIG